MDIKLHSEESWIINYIWKNHVYQTTLEGIMDIKLHLKKSWILNYTWRNHGYQTALGKSLLCNYTWPHVLLII